MIIPPNAIYADKWDIPPIKNLSKREIDAPEGVGFDLRLSAVHRISGQGVLRCDTRKTSESELVDPDANGIYELTSDHWYLVSTEESMSFPEGIAGLVFPRSTLFRSGVSLHSSVVPPGYVGPLVFGLNVHLSSGFVIERLARFCHIVLFQVAEGSTLYRGQWNGGRVSHSSTERQI